METTTLYEGCIIVGGGGGGGGLGSFQSRQAHHAGCSKVVGYSQVFRMLGGSVGLTK